MEQNHLVAQRPKSTFGFGLTESNGGVSDLWVIVAESTIEPESPELIAVR